MDLLRTLRSRLNRLNLDPSVAVPVLEALDDTLVDINAEIRSDTEMAVADKGHAGMVLSKVQKAVRSTTTALRSPVRQAAPPKKALNNSHLL